MNQKQLRETLDEIRDLLDNAEESIIEAFSAIERVEDRMEAGRIYNEIMGNPKKAIDEIFCKSIPVSFINEWAEENLNKREQTLFSLMISDYEDHV